MKIDPFEAKLLNPNTLGKEAIDYFDTAVISTEEAALLSLDALMYEIETGSKDKKSIEYTIDLSDFDAL